MPILQTSRRASDTKTEAEPLDEDVYLTLDEKEAQAQFEDIPKVPERVSYAAGSLADTSSNKDLAHTEQELVHWALNECVQGSLGHRFTDEPLTNLPRGPVLKPSKQLLKQHTKQIEARGSVKTSLRQ
jgi:hypothetical protein